MISAVRTIPTGAISRHRTSPALPEQGQESTITATSAEASAAWGHSSTAHVTEKGASDPHFISAQGKREKILSLAVQSDISVVWKFQFLNWCMYHCFSSFILVSTHSRYFHGV